ncbi:MAG: NTP transferase domain-containing protein [Proteobacteria bacterium]|nr:CBS domain-containing protein [Pseudomonadota bacterium]NOG59061.1 NTP transferase domain-containing protein [Pseudomonadota bacterium]
MKSLDSVLVTPKTTLREVIRIIDAAATKLALVVDNDHRLLGTLADGDIRRGFLRGLELSDTAASCMHENPATANIDDSSHVILTKMRKLGIQQIPLLDNHGRVVDLKLLKDFLTVPERNNWVIIMAGGLGTRLKELTKDTPKPMLSIGDRPLLETIISRFIDQGFSNFLLAVNYKSHKIEEYFGNGEKLGVNINYLRENKRLGTAGALSMLPSEISEPLLITNADLLSTVDYGELLDSHYNSGAVATMAVREYEYQIPYGVVEVSTDKKILALEEKPVHQTLVNAGIYVLSPVALKYIAHDVYVDMPEVFSAVLSAGHQAVCHPVHGYWLDIGKHEDFNQANLDYAEFFS